jgi:hypothetical protein
LQAQDGPVEITDAFLTERTVRAAVDAAVLVERARCAKAARDAWMSDKVSGGYINGMIAVCNEIAKIVEAKP